MNAFELNTDVLAEYLEGHLPGFRGPLSATKFDKGQSNPTYHLKWPGGSYVLRRKPPGKLLKSAHAVEREYRILCALQDSQVPVAKPRLLCEDESIIGSVFYVMQYIEGRVFWDPLMPDLNNDQRAAHYRNMNTVMADLHSVDIEAVGLSDFGRPEGFIERQIQLWSRQYRATETERIDDMESLLEKLPKALPQDDGKAALIHGDFRLDNMMFNQHDGSVRALVDWELSTLGHPFTDLAYQCMQWRMPGSGPLPGLDGIDRDSLGIPTEERYIADYCNRAGLSGIAHWEFYLALSFFRFAAILQGVRKRAMDGNASNQNALRMGDYVAPLARMGVEQLS